MRRHVRWLVALAVVGAVSLEAQQPLSSTLLEVASVTRNISGPGNQSLIIRPGGTVVVTNFPIEPLVSIAYGLQMTQVTGGPEWLRRDRYDIVAKPSTANASLQMLQAALRAVLAERFMLRTHIERREQPVYAFVHARGDRQLGPKMTLVPTGCGAPPDPSAVATPVRCNINTPQGRVVGSGVTIPMLAAVIGQRGFDRVIVDKTGLTGWFDLELEFVPDAVGGTAAATGGITLVTALQEQLGLKLEPDRATVDVLVIDSIERPAEN